MSKKKENQIDILNNACRKLMMLGLSYEFNQLQFSVLAYTSLYQEKCKEQDFSLDDAIGIVLKYFPACFKESRKYLTYKEFDIILRFTVTCLLQAIRSNSCIKNDFQLIS